MNTNQEQIDGLRALAEFLEECPLEDIGYMMLNFFLPDREALAKVARKIGSCEKGTDTNFYFLRKVFGGNVSAEWNVRHANICERVITGKRTIEKPIMQQIGTETVEEDVIEWKCPESLLRGREADSFAGVDDDRR